jgi:hypothetical protein
MARRKGRKTSVRSPSKSMEKELVHRAERLARDPGLALPKVIPPCAKSPFDKVLRKMERISRFSDNEERLKKLASGGDQIARAYAGTLMLKAAGKAPYLATLKLPQGEVFYAMRGNAKKEKLAGMQWFDHPVYRLLLYLDLAIKRPHFHFYSTRDVLYCSCKEARPPREYVDFAVSQLKGNLTEVTKDVWACPHVDVNALTEAEPVDDTYLRVQWQSAGVLVGICRRCARSGKGSVLGSLTMHMAVPRIEDDFEVAVLHRLAGAADCALWDRLSRLPIDEDHMAQYVQGALDDGGLIDRHLSTVDEELREYKGPHFILEDRCFCDDAKAFVEALKPSEEERVALEAILPSLDRPVILDRATSAKVLAELWADHGEEALRAVVEGDEELMERYIDHPDVQSSPTTVLRRALIDHRTRTIIERLPKYGRLPAIARFADAVARAYKTEGAEGALKTLERERGSDTRIKSVAYAFLLALGREAAKKWQYDRTEMDFATFLKDKAEDLLEARPEGYHEALQAILSSTGSTEHIPDPGGK